MFRNFIFLITFCIASSTCFAQSRQYPVFNFEGKTLSQYLTDYVGRMEVNQFQRLCLKSCTFAKFHVDDLGNVTGIATNKYTIPLLDSVIREAISSTAGKWQRTANKEGADFLVPFVYNFATNCKESTDRTNESVGSMLEFSEVSSATKEGKPFEGKIMTTVFFPMVFYGPVVEENPSIRTYIVK